MGASARGRGANADHREALALGSLGQAIVETHECEGRGSAFGRGDARRELERVGSA